MKTEKQLYYKLFNRITDTIETLEKELEKLRKAQIECENALLGLDEDGNEIETDEESGETADGEQGSEISMYP